MRYILLMFSLLASLSGVSANSKAEIVVDEAISAIKSYNPYRVDIRVSYSGDSISGFYEVDGANYYISIEEQELYGDSKVKYEVFNARKEVVIDAVSSVADGNILNNPATAFTTIKDHYSASILSENNEFTIVELKPNVGGDTVETIELKLSNTTKLPSEIIYKMGDDKVVITINKISRLTSPISLYNSTKYADYEIIDFR